MNKKISVVMSTYNEPVEWVEKSIRSILNQTYDNIEVIVICDNPDNKGIVDLLNLIKEEIIELFYILMKEIRG